MVFRRTWLLVLATAVVAVACVAGDAPKITNISPQGATAGLVQGTITGHNFYPRIVPDAGNPSQSTMTGVQITFSLLGQAPLVVQPGPGSNTTSLKFSETLAAGPYTVTVSADGGTTSHSFAVGQALGQASRLVFNSASVGLGTSDQMTLTMSLVDNTGGAAQFGSAISASLLLSGSSASVTPAGPLSIPQGSTSASFTVHDQRAEKVKITTSTASFPSLGVTPGLATFTAGPPFAGRVVGVTGSTNSASTVFLIQDLYGNPTAVETPFLTALSASLTAGSPCPAENVPPVTVASLHTAFAFTMTCDEVAGNTGTYTVTGQNPTLIESSGTLNFQ